VGVYILHAKRARQRIDNSRVGGCVRVCCARFKLAELRFPRRSRHTHTYTKRARRHRRRPATSTPRHQRRRSPSVRRGVERERATKIHARRERLSARKLGDAADHRRRTMTSRIRHITGRRRSKKVDLGTGSRIPETRKNLNCSIFQKKKVYVLISRPVGII